MTDKACPVCGVDGSPNGLRGGYDCLNRDCPRCWYGHGDKSLVGIRRTIELELARPDVVFDSVAVPRAMLVRLVMLLGDGDRCVRCGWVKGDPPLDCQNDGTPHEFAQGEWKAPSHNRLNNVVARVRQEAVAAMHRFPPFNSPHEGKAVIEEELEELWDHCKANTGRSDDAMKEAIQVAAMAIRYVYDLESQ